MVKNFIHSISFLTRAKDWRLSFVPFIMGCVYLWLGWFKIAFNASSVLLVVLSLVTTVGFASLGYYINEYFDIEADKKAGKINRLAFLSIQKKILFLIGSIALTFLPWIWLPADIFSWSLIGLQVLFFLFYSVPFFRFKEIPFVSNFIDACYAYWIPLMLSYHTYSLYTNSSAEFWFPFFSVAVFLVGFRNILIHQIDDIFNDKRAGITTMPMVLGVAKTDFVLKMLIIHEVFFLSCALLIAAYLQSRFLFAAIMYLLFTFYKVYVHRNSFSSKYFSITISRHFTDSNNQYVLPLSWLVTLGFSNVAWLSVVPFHLMLLFPINYIVTAINKIIPLWYVAKKFIMVDVRHVFSLGINYPIYFAFKIVGIDLIKEKKSAAEVLFGRKRKV
jgi:4-hydroxybenzoate polyprenyltransferase